MKQTEDSSVDRKNKFLGLFWDLASEDQSKRLAAATSIVAHVDACEKAEVAGSNTKASDTEYTLKRLVRGLSSSREAARQGFATCLCEIIKFPSISVAEALTTIDECTQVSGSMKGAEERDMLFGKLFGYIAIIRSGRLSNESNDISINVFNRILELHNKKGMNFIP